MEFQNNSSSSNCKISICIPAYNNLDSLSVALESICLQNYSNLEILISDDHSPNSVRPVFDQWANEYPNYLWRYCYQEKNLGIVQNQAWLLNNASGELMTFFQHDDYLIDPDFYLKIVNHRSRNKETKIYMANAVMQSPLAGDLMNKRFFPLNPKKQDFKTFKPRKFLKYLIPSIYGSALGISWSSLVFEVDSAKSVKAFSSEYLTDISMGAALNTFVDEEAGIFLCLLNDRFSAAFSKQAVTYRGILETSYSLSKNNPNSRLVNGNNIEVFNFLRASKLALNFYTRFRMILRAVSIGLNTDNVKVREYLGPEKGSKLLIFICLLSGKFVLPVFRPALRTKVRLKRISYLAICQPKYFKSVLIKKFTKNESNCA